MNEYFPTYYVNVNGSCSEILSQKLVHHKVALYPLSFIRKDCTPNENNAQRDFNFILLMTKHFRIFQAQQRRFTDLKLNDILVV